MTGPTGTASDPSGSLTPGAPREPDADALLTELGAALAPQLQVLHLLGRGGMGLVYLGRDPLLSRLVAIKVLNPDLAHDESARLRFEREAEAAAAVVHPNIVGIHQVGRLPVSQAAYFVMPFVDGRTLAEEHPAGQPAPNPVVRRTLGEIASALAAAHAKGLVHRDVKPANVIVDRETGRSMVLDFGISAVVQPSSGPASPRLTATGMYVGTPMYMSPEQASGEPATAKSDIYALGVVGFELLVGRPPFSGRTALELIASHLKEAPPDILEERPDADPAVAKLIQTCLAKTPEERPSASEIARFLLPSHAAMEWPPPGLETIRGAGARLTTRLGVCALVLWTFLLTLLLQPTQFQPCCWDKLEGEGIFAGIGEIVTAIIRVQLEPKDIGPLYSLIIVFSVIAVPFVWFVLARASLRLSGEAGRARRAGYPWSVILSAAWDAKPDTSALLNGSDDFAMADEPLRKRMMKRRHVESMLVAAAIVTGLLIPVAWSAGVFGATFSSGAALTGTEYIRLGAIPFLLLAAAAWSSRLEFSFRIASRAKRRRRIASSPIRPDLAADWLSRAGKTRGSGKPRVPAIVLPYAVGFLVTPGIFAVLLALGAVLLASWNFARAGDFKPSMRQSGIRPLWTRARRLNQDVRLTDWHDPRAQLFSALLNRGDRRAPIPFDSNLLARYPLPVRDLSLAQLRLVDRAHITRPDRLTPDMVLALAADTLDTRLAVWRAFAHSPPPPFLWYLTESNRAAIPDGSFHTPSIDARLRAKNISAALLAIRRGDSAEARLRLRENQVVSWRLGTSSVRSSYGTTAATFQTIGRALGDEKLLAEGKALAGAGWEVHYNQTKLLFADATNPPGLEWIADTTLSPGLRLSLLEDIGAGFCGSAREILFGVDPRRREILDRAALSVRDVPFSSEFAALQRPELDRLIDDPEGELQYRFRTSATGIYYIPWILGLRGLTARMLLC